MAQQLIHYLQSRLTGLILAGAFVAGLCTAMAFMGRLSWFLELTTHFHVQYFCYLLSAALVMTLFGRKRAAVACAALAVLNLFPVSALMLPAKGPTTDTVAGTRPLRALLLNVKTENTRYASVVSLIRRSDADFVVLEEIDETWESAVSALSDVYPHVVSVPRRDNFGILLMSSQPIQTHEVLYFGDAKVPSIAATYDISGQTLTLVATHPVPPMSARHSEWRNDQLSGLAGYLADISGPRVLLGDLNITPWSPHFKDLLSESGLKDSAQGRGASPSWPAYFWPLRIPIDHCLHSRDIKILDRRIGEDVGSDHLPVHVVFQIPSAQTR